MKILLNSLLTVLTLAVLPLLQSCNSMKFEEGDVSYLFNQNRVKVEFDYTNMRVKGFATEKEFVDKKVAEDNEKESGKGDDWSKQWIRDRIELFQPKFEDLLNKYMREKGVKFDPDANDAKYTMIVKTTSMGNVLRAFIFEGSAEIDLEITFAETADKSKILAKILMQDVTGTANNHHWGGSSMINNNFVGGNNTIMRGQHATSFSKDELLQMRICQAYAKAGKELGKFLKKSIK